MPLLEIKGLSVGLKNGKPPLLKEISFSVKVGEILGILGESGSGKSLTALSILKLLPQGLTFLKGEILFQGKNLLSLKEKEINQLRGKEISLVFQDPLSSLNPVLTIGEQLKEVVDYHLGLKGRESHELILKTLKEVGIPDPELRLKNYPHELSGGLRQRVMIAMAILCSPKLLIADEPTTALDLTLQMQVLELLKTLNRERNLSILFITHDLGILRWFADRIVVYYQGEVLELAQTTRLFKAPLHPYTQLLFASYPGRGDEGELRPLEGEGRGEAFCSFYERCRLACDAAKIKAPALVEVEPGHLIRCFHYGK